MLTSLAAAAAATGNPHLPGERHCASFDARQWDESMSPSHLPVSPAGTSSTTLECEGNACDQVTLTFDETKQQYLAQNVSDRVVRVEASNWAGGRSAIVEAGKSAYLPLKSFIGPYRANYE